MLIALIPSEAELSRTDMQLRNKRDAYSSTSDSRQTRNDDRQRRKFQESISRERLTNGCTMPHPTSTLVKHPWAPREGGQLMATSCYHRAVDGVRTGAIRLQRL